VEGVAELAGDEDFGAIETRGANRLADLLFVAVHLGSVDVAVADLERLSHRFRGVLGLDLEDPETELRYGVAVVEGDVGYCAHGSLTPSFIVTSTRSGDA
jgi:hypothetical protein